MNNLESVMWQNCRYHRLVVRDGGATGVAEQEGRAVKVMRLDHVKNREKAHTYRKAACSCANAPIRGPSTFLFAAWRGREGSVTADATYIKTLIRSTEDSEADWQWTQ
jgi:hypothetical protein